MTQQTVATAADYHEQVSRIVTEELELEEGELTDEGHFTEDYDSDSLSLITVVSRIEKELGVSIPKTELGELVNLRLLVGAVAQHAGEDAHA
ncbi:acyl carrier protein [Streptomyces sp. S1A]|uniref:Acyl carrier protein n=1 Tax=Streptomyces chitinivorans TaxID=1257027 RepID=A0ABW7HYS8_9ACTN|nr:MULTISPECIES: acyl carrier protein [Streptomyces]MCG3043843.1 acyl carrier protein [Streptomyces sp. ICN903]MDH2411576.1 acyl carrier protein [Streptomyces chitinivorans]